MKNHRLIFAALAVAAIWATSGCTKPEDDSELSLSLPVKSVTSAAGDQMIRVTATGDWTLSLQFSDGGDWASVDHSSGKNSMTGIILKWDENKEEEERTCTIVLQKGTRKAEAALVQSAYVPVLEPDDPNSIKSDPVPDWLELPATNKSDLYFLTHDMVIGSKKIRNYSYYYDTKALLSHWVAYPLNFSLRGTGSRTDQWGYDPKVPTSLQPLLASNYSKDGDGVSYTRGHQIPSADRLTSGYNEATFYYTNMTPQLYDLNTYTWATLEGMVRTWSYSCDTLYVVTGADINGSTKHVLDNDNTNPKSVTVPVGYYKALVAYDKSKTDEYIGIAFYFDHKEYAHTKDAVMSCSMTIRDLEKKVGEDFFVNLPKKISYAEKVETTVDKWWENTAN